MSNDHYDFADIEYTKKTMPHRRGNRMETDIVTIQKEIASWADRNFGIDRPFRDPRGLHPLLGIVEEVGELCRARLKEDQGIRNISPDDEIDAIGDILIYILHYCARRGFNAEDILRYTWDKVRRRDWKADPVEGSER